MSAVNLNEFPNRTNEHVGETESVNALHLVLKDPHFLLRTLSERDYGVDLLLELLLNGNPSNWTTKIQVKSTTGDLNPDGSVSRQIDRVNLYYMLSSAHSFYVVYHRGSQTFRYRFAQKVLDDYQRKSGWHTQEKLTVRCDDLLDAKTAAQLHADLISHFSHEKAVRTRGSYESFLDKLKQLAQGQVQFDAVIEAVTRETVVQYTRGRDLIGAARFKDAVERLRDAQRLAAAAGDVRLCAKIEVALGGALVFLGSIPEAIEALAPALSTLLSSEAVEDQAHVAFAYGNLALAKDFQAKIEESRTLLDNAIALLEKHADEHIFALASMYLLKAQSILRTGDIDDVVSLLDSFFACLERIPQADAAPLLAAAWGVYGNRQLKLWRTSLEKSDLEAARSCFERGLVVAEYYQLPDMVLRCRYSLAQCVWFEGLHEQARKLFLDIATAAKASEYVLIELDARHDAAGVLLHLGNMTDALPEIRAVKHGYEKLGGHPNLAKINSVLSMID